MMRIGAALAALCIATTAQAESVKLTGRFPAAERQVAMLRSVAVERFSGRDGAALSLALERALANGRHFDVVPADRRGDAGGADGVISGAVSAGVQESDFDKTEKRCVERDATRKCTKEEQVKVRCTRRIVEFSADVRVVDAAKNRVLFSAERPKRDELTWCGDEEPARTAEQTVRTFIATTASELAAAFTPRDESYSVRFRESTKGLPKEAERLFKDIVKQTQRDLPGACAAWRAMAETIPDHPSILFDLGLCAEAAGNWTEASDFYAKAAPLLGRDSEAATGVRRIADLTVARADDAARR